MENVIISSPIPPCDRPEIAQQSTPRYPTAVFSQGGGDVEEPTSTRREAGLGTEQQTRVFRPLAKYKLPPFYPVWMRLQSGPRIDAKLPYATRTDQ